MLNMSKSVTKIELSRFYKYFSKRSFSRAINSDSLTQKPAAEAGFCVLLISSASSSNDSCESS